MRPSLSPFVDESSTQSTLRKPRAGGIVRWSRIAVQYCFSNSPYAKLEWVFPMRSSLVPAVLRYVDQVARSGSIQRAAKELNIAASAINRQILTSEQDLGVALFERVSKGM